MRLFSILVMMLVTNTLFSQSAEKNIKKVQFEMTVLAGPTDGERGTSAQIEVIPSIKYKGYYIGVGTGVDYYFIRTIPVFLELKKVFTPIQIRFLYMLMPDWIIHGLQIIIS